MSKRIDITGQRFYFATALEYLGNGKQRFLCDCGVEFEAQRSQVSAGLKKSCGCKSQHGLITHGHTAHGKTSETYASWNNMRSRCYYPQFPGFKHYGGRGITVCDRWINGEDGLGPFECFLADMGVKPEGLTLERVDSDGDYTPDNCIWATWTEQANNRSNNVRIECRGFTLTVAVWSRLLGIPDAVIRRRLKLGWAPEDILTKPVARRVRLSSESILDIHRLSVSTPIDILADMFGVRPQRVREILKSPCLRAEPRWSGQAGDIASGDTVSEEAHYAV